MSNPTTFKRTKILATLGPATNTPDMIEQLMQAGTNGFRLNFSHGSYEERDQQLTWIRQASHKLDKPVAILQDLQGPKIRLGMLKDKVEVNQGDILTLDYAADHDGALVLPVQYNLATKVKVGESLYIFDGKIKTQVIEVASDTAIKVKVANPGTLMSKKGINLPDTDFSGDILTEKDLKDVEYGATKDIDYVALSFVQSADDIHQLRSILHQLGSTAQIVAKIETKAAVKDETLEEIIIASDGVMIARGDLAVEAGAEIVPIVQRRIIALCRKHGKLSIVATQMMASMVDSPEPTRAEVGDVATAVILGADTVMLSDETANGSYPLQTVAAMKKVIVYTQQHSTVTPAEYIMQSKSPKADAISAAAITLARQMNAQAIVAETKSGTTATNISAQRPAMPIISVASDNRVAQQLALWYACKSFIHPDAMGAGLQVATQLKHNSFFGSAETLQVVVVSGQQPGVPGTTDTIRFCTL